LIQCTSANHIIFYLLCLVDLKEGRQYVLEELLSVALMRMDKIISFSQHIGDDSDAAIEGLLLSLPAEHLPDPVLRSRVLLAMKPTLEKLKPRIGHMITRPDGRATLRNVLGRAATLAGLNSEDYLDEGLLDEVLSKLR
jgi:hypothetical protein